MPSRPPWWQASLSFLSQAGPDEVTRRPCGCRLFIRACWVAARQDGTP